MVSSTEVNTTVPVKILRNGKSRVLKVKIGKRPEDLEEIEEIGAIEQEGVTFRGMEVDDITTYYRQRYRTREKEGVIIINIEEGSAADEAGLDVGDVIII